MLNHIMKIIKLIFKSDEPEPVKTHPDPEILEKLWYHYLYQDHEKEKLESFARRLKLFRFCRAVGGHANDGDSLQVLYKFDSWEILEHFCRTHDIPLVKFSEKPPQPIPGQSYSHSEYTAFPSLIQGAEWVKQPSFCMLYGVKIHAWCSLTSLSISLHDGFDVTDKNIADAEHIEKVLLSEPLLPFDPPVDNKRCICPKFHPYVFSSI